MSLILDALNRSRGEQDPMPTLATRHDYADPRPPVRMWALLVALVLAVLLIAWLLWERATSPAVEQALSPPLAAQGSDKVAQPELPAAPPAEVSKAPVAPTPEQKTAAKTVAEPPQPATETAPALSVKSSADVSALYGAEPVALAPQSVSDEEEPAVQAPPVTKPVPIGEATVDETDLDIEQLMREAEDELENARLAEHPAPFITDLSQQTKDAIPSIFYERHDYSGRPGQSTVVLNGKELKAGGSPASGVKVSEILSDSVVLDYRGTQFRLRALNSWVNL